MGIYGFSLLPPANVDWCLYKTGDTSQHFLGGWAFLRDQWRWPLGIFYGLSDPDPAAVSIIDGIPLMAFAVKLIRGPQAAPFQYLGMWSALSFALQGVFAALLMKKLTSNSFVQLAGVFFLLLSVPFLNLGPQSAGLSSHFLILWGLCLMLSKWNFNTACQWIFLLIISLMVHPYLAAMCGALYLGATIQTVIKSLKSPNRTPLIRQITVNWLVCAVFCSATIYTLGLLHIGTEASVGIFGQSQVNLDCLLNPQSGNISALVLPMPVPMEAELLYTGVGGWILLLFFMPSLFKLLKRNSSMWKYYGIPAVILILMLLFAFNCRIYIGKDLLLSFIWPPELKNIAGTFRAAGRFAWPIWYLLLALAVARLAREKVLWIRMLTILAVVVLQIYDLGNGIIAHTWAKNMARKGKKYVCPYAQFALQVEGRKKLCYSYKEKDFAPSVYFAMKNNMVVEDFYFPRNFYRSRQSSEIVNLLQGKKFDKNGIYLLDEKEVKRTKELYPELRPYIYPTREKSIMIIPAGESLSAP